MGVKAESEQLHELIDPKTEAEQIGTGFTFTEGPIWNPAGQYLLFSDMPGDTRRRWDEQGGVREVSKPSNKGNGMTLDTQGRLIVCEHSTSSVVRMSPNDVVVHSSGAIYFTDPTYGRVPGFGIERAQDLDFQGVYRIPPGGGELTLLVDDFVQPNGLCFSPDESLLYINDTDHSHIRIFDVAGDGTISNSRVLAEGMGDASKGEYVDGMKCDERGNVWVTGPKGVWVFAPSGEHLGVIEIPENVGNIHWGGPNWNWLFVPACTSVYRVKTKVSGRREPFMS